MKKKDILDHQGIHSSQKQPSGRKTARQKTYIAAGLIIALLGGATYITYQKNKDKEQIEHMQDIENYPFIKNHLPYRDDNPEYFVEDFKYKREKLAPGVEVIRDAGLVFYIVQKGDNLDIIRKKLIKIDEFSYIGRDEYDRTNAKNKTKSFNIPANKLVPGLYIPIPLDSEMREISPMDFANYCHEAIEEIKQDSNNVYNKELNHLLSLISEKELITYMVTFARSETAEDYTNFSDLLGSTELHRREPGYNAFSFTYFHILMEKNADGKTPGPGLKARKKLGLTEGQCYHPKNAAKLFIGYRVEKTNGKLETIFPITEENIVRVSRTYNGSSSYAEKIRPNLEYTYKLMNGEIIYYDNEKLENKGFSYTGLNSKDQHVYRISTPKNMSKEQIETFIVTTFNMYKDIKCPPITKFCIVTKTGASFPKNNIPDTLYVRANSSKK